MSPQARRTGQNSTVNQGAWKGIQEFFGAGLRKMADDNRRDLGLPPLVRPANAGTVRPTATPGARDPRFVGSRDEAFRAAQEGRFAGPPPSGNRQPVNNATGIRELGTPSTRGGQPVFWTGDKYGFQSGATAVKHGLLTPEMVGQGGSVPDAPVLPPPQTFGGVGTTAPIQTTETGGTPTFATSPAPTVSAQQTQQFQQAAGVAKAYQDQVAALENKFGGAPGLESVANMTSLPAGGISIPGVDKQTNVTLPQYYAAQEAVGAQRFNAKNTELDSVINQLGYDEKMKQWAMANPALAQREYARMLQRNAQAGTPVPASAPTENKVLSGQSLPGNVIDYPIS